MKNLLQPTNTISAHLVRLYTFLLMTLGELMIMVISWWKFYPDITQGDINHRMEDTYMLVDEMTTTLNMELGTKLETKHTTTLSFVVFGSHYITPS